MTTEEIDKGIRSLKAISGRNNIGFEEWMKLDIKYVRERSFKLDMKLILKTVLVLFGDKNAS